MLVRLNVAEFELPTVFNYTATFVLALTGALAASRRQYDIVGVFVLAFVTGLGGSLLRDCLFLPGGPPASMRDWHYLPLVFVASFLGSLGYDRLKRFDVIFGLLDAAGLAAYAIVGTQMALKGDLPVPAVIFVGTVNAVGGGLLRDVLVREEPLLFKPSQFYALVAALGATAFVLLRLYTTMPGGLAGFLACGLIFLLRVLAIRYDWKTSPLRFPATPLESGPPNQSKG
jgi:uncharacterized membrane protein YeiH